MLLGMGNAGYVIVDFSIQAADLGPSWAGSMADFSGDEHMVDGVDLHKPMLEGVLNLAAAGEERSVVFHYLHGFSDFAKFFLGWEAVGIGDSGFVVFTNGVNGVHGFRRELIHRLDEPSCILLGMPAVCCVFECECVCDFLAI